MKIKLKFDLKDHLGSIRDANLGSSWQKGLLLAQLVALTVFIGLCVYVFFRPIPSDLKRIIDDYVSSSNITFDQKTLDTLKERQSPPEANVDISGKNPFAPF